MIFTITGSGTHVIKHNYENSLNNYEYEQHTYNKYIFRNLQYSGQTETRKHIMIAVMRKIVIQNCLGFT